MAIVRQFETFIDRFREKFNSFWFNFSIIFLLLVGYQLTAITADPDLFARIAVGKLFENLGTIIKVDPFAFTAKKALWIDHEWLSGVVFYQISQLGGDWTIYLAKLIFMGLTLFFVLQAQKLFYKQPLFILTLLLMLGSGYIWASNIRSQVFTYLFLPIFVIYFEKLSNGKKFPLVVLPLLMLFWCNAHGGFVVGLGLLFVYTFLVMFLSIFKPEYRRHRGLFIQACIYCLLATFLTPYSIQDFLGYVLEATTMPRPSISEWGSVHIFSIEALFPLIIFAITAIGYFHLQKKEKFPVIHLILLLLSFYQGMKHERLQAIFYILVAIYGGVAFLEFESLLNDWSKMFIKLKRAVFTVVLLSIFLIAGQVIGFAANFNTFRLDVSGYPVHALNWLKENREGGKLLVDFNKGSYALWSLYPKFLISLDGRYEEVYPESTVYQVSDAITPDSKNHLSALSVVNPDFVLIETGDLNLKDMEQAWPDFQLMYRDEKHCLLEKGLEPLEPQEVASDTDIKRSHDMWNPGW